MRAMADTGTTHNFVVDQEIARLGLKLGGDTSRMKTVNSASQLVVGTACDVLVNVGTWSRHIVLLVFLALAKPAVVRHPNVVTILDESHPCIVPIERKGKGKMLSAL
ncbi:hypothetical protein AMTRI_Chr04g186250 [Amborella trichopoda]